MRTLILAATAAFGISIGTPAQAQQSTAPGQQMQSDKQMQEEADKGIKTRNSGEAGFVGQQESPGASAHPPGRPDTGSSQTTTGSGAGTGGGQGSETSRTPR
ncbi:hypothetical protein KIP88_33295 [Bradyrhizobium sp. SRL28]|uniref:hypothetical protein n=1 Tax=Bradyrhizobium sp. SRL28 TaxID=2836178 RepID=UPI001BDF49BB|nr:hypothetical protein [Bradyrhizobium sp. SRL28]MBT1515373.1 hypothetical protein [Bradyrhizobium sp. SRL28]